MQQKTLLNKLFLYLTIQKENPTIQKKYFSLSFAILGD